MVWKDFSLFLEDKWNKLESEFSKMNMRNDNWTTRWFDVWKTHWNMDTSIRIEDILLKQFSQMLVKIFMMMVKTNMECYPIMSLINIYLSFNHIFWATNKNIKREIKIYDSIYDWFCNHIRHYMTKRTSIMSNELLRTIHWMFDVSFFIMYL